MVHIYYTRIYYMILINIHCICDGIKYYTHVFANIYIWYLDILVNGIYIINRCEHSYGHPAGPRTMTW